MAYALENGEVGVYRQEKVVWAEKESQSRVVGLVRAECEEGSNVGEHFLVVARRDGTIEVRHALKGVVMQKIDNKCGPLAGLLYDDLRGTKSKQLIALYKDGTVKGYILIGLKEQTQTQLQQASDASKLNEVIEELTIKKNDLLAKIASIPKGGAAEVSVPKDCKVEVGFIACESNEYVELVVKCT